MTRESPWDDSARGRALRLAEYEAGMCTCGCGLPRATAHDKKQPFLVDTFNCYAGRALEIKKRADRTKAEQQNWPEGWDDGKHYYATPVADERERGPSAD